MTSGDLDKLAHGDHGREPEGLLGPPERRVMEHSIRLGLDRGSIKS